MTASDGFIELLKDALQALGPVSVRRMFGGAGVYADGVMFALVADDTLYLKADETTRGAHETEGLGPFVYRGQGKTVTMSYWRAPERLLDDPDEMAEWARRALAVARRAGARKARAKPESGPEGRVKRTAWPAGAPTRKPRRKS
ncbi:MAG: TfoX/Sxy family protein [Pseudomonadota bacterium]